MSTDALAASLDAVYKVFPDNRERQVCAYVFQALRSLKDQFNEVTLGAVATALNWTQDREGQRAIVRVLDYLSFGEMPPILERRFFLWSSGTSNEVLEEPLCELTDAEIRQALEEELLVVPTTGEQLHNFQDYITVVYMVTTFAHSLALDSSGRPP
jgi:hypothetical protein